MARKAQWTYILKLHWRSCRGQHHPGTTFTDELPTAERAIEVGTRSLKNNTSQDLTCVSAWWREVQPGETWASGQDTWHPIGRTDPHAAGG